jgi:nucleoid-associated protein EbfC
VDLLNEAEETGMTEPPTMGDLMNQVKELRQNLLNAHAELSTTEVTGTAGDGRVKVTMLGSGEVTSVRFDQGAVDEGDAEALAALTLTALRNATDAVKVLTTQRMGDAVGGNADWAGRLGPGHAP